MGLTTDLEALVAIFKATTTTFERPDRLPRAMLALAPWGTNSAGLAAAGAARYPNRIAFIDETRGVTYQQLWQRVRRIRGGLHEQGLGPGLRVGVMMRNHIGFAEAFLAVAATGADMVLLNTGFGSAQLADVVDFEGINLVIHDDEFGPVVGDLNVLTIDETRLEEFATSRAVTAPRRQPGTIIILTSGTTGRPKGAQRSSNASSVTGIGGMLERVPLRLGDTQFLAAPMFHAWGLSNLLLGLSRSATTILSRRFEPELARQLIDQHQARVLIVVPVMLQRLLADDDSPLPSVELIAASGSAMPSGLVQRAQAAFGNVLYNLYGSTEVSVATIATPTDLAEHPDTAGRPTLGVKVRVLDADGDEVPDGEVGRIFVGSGMRFDGYTGGDTKEERDGLLSTGDLGSFRGGLLYVEGREDDMIVSGGENVYPAEIENLLSEHPEIADVAVVGVPDDEFGQVMAAFIVRTPRSKLNAAAVKQHVGSQLARHKAPRHVSFIDALPRNETGKVLRSQLTKR